MLSLSQSRTLLFAEPRSSNHPLLRSPWRLSLCPLRRLLRLIAGTTPFIGLPKGGELLTPQ
jgi:hypothetical protein